MPVGISINALSVAIGGVVGALFGHKLPVFAVGDVRTKALRQVVTAVADGATAVHYAEEYLAGGI